MKNQTRKTILLIAVSGLCALPALAQPPRQGEGRPNKPDRPNRQEILQRFDADQDGTLNETEREAARKAMQERREARQQERATRRQERIDAGLPVGPGPEEIRQRFDADADGRLGPEERKTARETLREERQAKRQEKGRNGQEKPNRPNRP